MKEDSVQKQQALALAEKAAEILDGKKGIDVSILEVGTQTVIADYFVLATGTSNTHVRALADEVEFKIKEELGIDPNHIEGEKGDVWTLLDYGSVVIHVFTRQGRDFYKLERLWTGSEIRKIGSEE